MIMNNGAVPAMKKGTVPALDLRAALSRSGAARSQQVCGSPPTPSGCSGQPKKIELEPFSSVIAKVAKNEPNKPDVAFVAHLKQWQEIDATDYEGKWFQAVVVLRNEHYIRVHFVGWETQWSENIPVQEAYCRLRPRRPDTKVGLEGAQTVKNVMKLYRCGCSACRRSHYYLMQFRCSGTKNWI
jgi:hypothetical protein